MNAATTAAAAASPVPHPTSTWSKLGTRFYRRIPLYTSIFDPEFDLSQFLVAAAPYAGAVAFARSGGTSGDRLVAYHGAGAAGAASSAAVDGRDAVGRASVDVYSAAGRLIRRAPWDGGEIKGVAWSESEGLVVVGVAGSVRYFDGLGSDFVPFSLGHGAEEHGVLSCRFWSHGFVALLGNNQLVVVNSYTEPRPKLLASPPIETVHAWTLIAPTDSMSRSVEVLLAIGSSIYVVDSTDCDDRGLDAGPFRHLSVSPNGKFVALYTDDSKVWVISSDFQNRLSEYESKVKTVPKDMQWCGNDAVALAWEDEVHLVGPNGDSSKFYYDGSVRLLQDSDGIRLITNDVCEFLQRVPDETMDVFKLGSTSPAAVLLDAVDQLEQKSSKADDDIQIIRSNLEEAVDNCIRAAGHEFNGYWQKQLMKAASFGKSVLDFYSSDDFVDMTETLRVLNAVRFYEVGLPISLEQYLRLTSDRLIERLMNRHDHLLALKISDYLRLPTNKIYVHWACQKVRVSSESEDVVCRTIVKRLQGMRGISFEEIARAAFDEGRSKLATDLLNHEPRAGKQVPLLLDMKEETIALDKAIESGDSDLVKFVLAHLRRKLPLASFFRTINSRPVATALVEADAWDQERSMLKDLYYQDDRQLDSANLLLSESLDAADGTHRLDKLKSAAKLLNDSRENIFTLKALDETSKLLKTQQVLEKDFGPGFSGQSLNNTIYKLIRQGGLKRAQKIATSSDFRIPDRVFWWIKLRALVARRDWTELESLATQRKSPIGWEPFFNEVLAAGNLRLAGTFVSKCTNLTMRERVEMYIKCNMLPQAAEEAGKAKDLTLLLELRTKASDRDIQEVERWISIVQKK